MPLGINNQDIFTNTQYQQFVEFAKTSKTGDIAKMSLSPGGKEHSITATTESFIGRLFRSSGTKQANNYTRTIFKESIAKMFGGEDHIPDSVKDAMKMNDFGKGRPLTARRILAVKAAIDQVAAQFNAGVASNQEKYAVYDEKGVPPGTTGKLIETAFTACKGNSDAMEIVDKHMNDFLLNDASQFRPDTANYIQKRVDGLLSNLNELKALSTKNPAIYEAGKQMLLETGKPLPRECSARWSRPSTVRPSTASASSPTPPHSASTRRSCSWTGPSTTSWFPRVQKRNWTAPYKRIRHVSSSSLRWSPV